MTSRFNRSLDPFRLITSELFTQGPRTAAVPVVTLVNWAGNMLVGFTFPTLAIALGSQVNTISTEILNCTGLG